MKLQSGDAAGVTCRRAAKIKVQTPPCKLPGKLTSQLAWQQAQTNPQDRSGAKPKIRYEGVFDLRTRYPVFWAPFPSTGEAF